MAGFEFDIPRENSVLGVIAQFTNGTLRQSESSKLQVGYFHESASSKEKAMLIVDTERLEYRGVNPDQDSVANGMKNYIGVFNKRTGKMKLIESNIFKMKPYFPSDDDILHDIVKDAQLSYAQKNDQLTTSFGSIKGKRAVDSRMRNKIESGALKFAMGSAIDSSDIQEKKPNEDVDNESTTIPPMNKEASTPDAVFSLESLIPNSALEDLKSMEKDFVNITPIQIAEWQKENKYPNYVMSHLGSMPLQELARSERARCLLFINYMTKMFKMTYKDFRRRDPLPLEIPKTVAQYLLETFTVRMENEGKVMRSMPLRLKDKLAIHMLALCLIIDDFIVDISELLLDLKMSVKRLSSLFNSIGAQMKTRQVSSSGETKKTLVAVLSIPLVFPTIKFIKKGKR